MTNIPYNQSLIIPNRGFIQVNGAAAEKFLQGQLTCNVVEAKENPGLLGAHCNPKGRILFTCRVFYNQDKYFLSVPDVQTAYALQTLNKYAPLSRVILEDATASMACVALIANAALNMNCHYQLSRRENNLLYLSTTESPDVPLTPIKNYAQLHIMPETEIANWIKPLDPSQKITQPNFCKLNEITHGIAEIYPETRERFTPHDINYHQLGAVSFDKGCYIGQEIVARMHYLGKLKKRLIRAQLTSEIAPQRGENIFSNDEEIAGIVVDFAAENEEIYQLLAMI
jgi:folate-binding protein YgfZ